MVDNFPSRSVRGLAVSDLHLFARRSAGEEYLHSLRSQLASTDVLVLNGDIFDFRWSTLPSVEATAARALEWLEALHAAYPSCTIHYVLGNHDCPTFFRARLDRLQRTWAGSGGMSLVSALGPPCSCMATARIGRWTRQLCADSGRIGTTSASTVDG